MALKAPFSLPNNLPELEGEANPLEIAICVDLSHLDIVEKICDLAAILTYQLHFKIYVKIVKQLLFLLPLPTDYVQQGLSFFHYSQHLGYQSSEQMIVCFTGSQTEAGVGR